MDIICVVLGADTKKFRTQDSVKLNEFFTYLFDEDVLKNKLREQWIKILDYNYVDNDIMSSS